jgi:hypothetical protein
MLGANALTAANKNTVTAKAKANVYEVGLQTNAKPPKLLCFS